MVDSAGVGRRILVVEDDPSISMGLKMNLEAEGYAVEIAEDGLAGLDRAREGQLDLIVLDLMLPKLNGFEMIKQLRAEQHTVPVIMLSARSSEMDKVMGLELGAEDYVTKPFGLAELLARVKAVLRRDAIARPRAAEVVRSGDLSILVSTRQVMRGTDPVPLTATEFDVLKCLVDASGRVLSGTRSWSGSGVRVTTEP